MAAQYTEITLGEMEKFLKRAFRILRPKQGQKLGEIYFDLTLGSFVGVRIWTSIKPHSGMGANVGEDAIRVQFVSLKDQGPLEKGKAPIVKRTQNWRDSLQDRIEEFAEKYADNEDFWENWAETRNRSGDVKKELKEFEEEDLEKEEPIPTPTYQRTSPVGDVTVPQINYIMGLARQIQDKNLVRSIFWTFAGFNQIPTRDELTRISKLEASKLINSFKLSVSQNKQRYAFEEV
jgi:hypothetical protein